MSREGDAPSGASPGTDGIELTDRFHIGNHVTRGKIDLGSWFCLWTLTGTEMGLCGG